jgi:ligand-binding SRPBCC domain-containing protein
MRFHFQTEQRLPYPLELVFGFFADPANLPRLMPPWQHARIDRATYVPPPPPAQPFPGSDRITAGTGTQLTITIRPIPLSPIRVSWDARIENFRWLEGFCDVQLSGPFNIGATATTYSPIAAALFCMTRSSTNFPSAPSVRSPTNCSSTVS